MQWEGLPIQCVLVLGLYQQYWPKLPGAYHKGWAIKNEESCDSS